MMGFFGKDSDDRSDLKHDVPQDALEDPYESRPTPKHPPLEPGEMCDQCGIAQAYFRVFIKDMEEPLRFCYHDFNLNRFELNFVAVDIHDGSKQLMDSLTPPKYADIEPPKRKKFGGNAGV